MKYRKRNANLFAAFTSENTDHFVSRRDNALPRCSILQSCAVDLLINKILSPISGKTALTSVGVLLRNGEASFAAGKTLLINKDFRHPNREALLVNKTSALAGHRFLFTNPHLMLMSKRLSRLI
jgi:hypothetical protein